MENDIEIIKNRIKNKRFTHIVNNNNNNNEIPAKENKVIKKTNFKYVKNLITRTLFAIIFILASIIYVNYSSSNLLMYKKYVLNDAWSFNKFSDFYNKKFGSILPLDKIVKDNSKPVFNETLVFKNSDPHYEGQALNVGNNYLTPALNSGIVVFIGEKENYNDTVIIQGVDGVDIWYGNLDNTNLKLYDYVEKGSLIGETKSELLYLAIQKDGNFISYEDYSK